MNQSSPQNPPLVAIVGRPNVGKSTLFNRLLGRRVAVVHDLPGTTRDRIYGELEWQHHCFQIVDTGGLLPGKSTGISGLILQQAQVAIKAAQLCLLVVDIRDGLTPLDTEVASLLRRGGKEVVVVMNKADGKEAEWEPGAFYRLGFEDCLLVSALHGLRVGELLDVIVEKLPSYSLPPRRRRTAIAVVGRPNVGKSTLINRLLGEERILVDEKPGTTRDTVDTLLQWGEREFLLLDTAGLLRKAHHHSAVERFSLSRTRRAISRADVVLLLLEGGTLPTRVDSSFIQIALEWGKACLIGVNKWDISGSLTTEEYQSLLQRRLPFAGFLPVIFFSALRKHALPELMEACDYVDGQRRRSVQTGILNRVLEQAQLLVSPPRREHKKFKIYYATQVKTAPPVFRLFVNDPRLLSKNYRGYLINSLRRAFGFEGVPIGLGLTKRPRRK